MRSEVGRRAGEASGYRRPHPPDQIGPPLVPRALSSRLRLLTIVSIFVENECHERTTPHTRHRPRRSRRRSALTAVSACSGSDGARATSDGKLEVVASFYPMEFLAEQIGGEHSRRSPTLTKPGVEPHDLELTPRQTAAAGRGRTWSSTSRACSPPWTRPSSSPAQDEDRRRRPDHPGGSTAPRTATTTAPRARTTAPTTATATRRPAQDPHIWLDPVKYAEVAKGVGEALEKADPDHAADYQKNTDALVAKLDGLDTEFKNGLKTSARKTFITTHAAFGYLAERYGLDRGGHHRRRPRVRAEPRPHQGPPGDREEGEGHHRLLRDARQPEDRQDPRRATWT